jgi:hypothetical protein
MDLWPFPWTSGRFLRFPGSSPLLSLSPSFFLLAGASMPPNPPSTPPPVSAKPESAPIPPSTPPSALPSTPLTSPQLSQQAARLEERNQRIIGSPEQRRVPSIPSRPITFEGRTFHHLPADLAAQVVAAPVIPPRRIRHSTRAPVCFRYFCFNI